MSQKFAEILIEGGKSNSLGRASEVIESVLKDDSRLGELYACLFEKDAWVRMRAADALEKICRVHPEWLLPYVDKFLDELSSSSQPSIQWHLAQMYRQVDLSPKQKARAIDWLKRLISTNQTDWIVAANTMDTLVQFTKDGSVSTPETIKLLKIQQTHKSNAVVKRAAKLLAELNA